MKQNGNKSTRAKKPDSSDPDRICPPGFYRVLCLGLMSLVVVLGLSKLVQALHESGASSLENQITVSSRTEGFHRTENSQDTFRSQRRQVEPDAGFDNRGKIPASQQDRVTAALQRLDDALASASAENRSTAEALKRFALSGSMAELQSISRRDVELLADYLTRSMSKGDIGLLLEQYLRLPADQLISKPNVEETLVGIYDAVSGTQTLEVRPSALVITDECLPDGRVTGNTHSLPSGTSTIYAVFENDRDLTGLDQVLAVWRNPDDEKMVFTEFESIREGSAYNYVWLNVKEGWPSGRYTVELYHPEAQSLLIGSESFSVR